MMIIYLGFSRSLGKGCLLKYVGVFLVSFYWYMGRVAVFLFFIYAPRYLLRGLVNFGAGVVDL